MRAEDKERLARRQRMLARERGEPLPQPPAQSADKPPAAPPPAAPPAGAAQKKPPARPAATAAAQPPQAAEPAPAAARLRPLSPILRRRKRRRRLAAAALALAALLVLAGLSGALGALGALAGDAVDSAYLYLHRGSGWPAETGIESPSRVEPLAGGFVVLDAEDTAVYSAYGSCIRTIQPGYARPALAAGNTRFVLYDRAGTSVRVESRTRTLKTLTMPQAVMLCAISSNGTLGVVTQAERYVAQLQLLDAATYEPLFTWKMTREDGTPVALAFAPDNRRFAVGTVAARDGRLVSKVSLSRIAGKDAPLTYTADAGSMILQLQWLPGGRLLAVLDTCAVLLDPDTGTELARYDFTGRELLGVSVSGHTAALLLGSHSGSSLVLLDAALTLLAEADAAQATAVTCTDTAAYLIENNTVACYTLDGSLRWVHAYESRPQLVLDAAQTLLFTAGRAEVLSAPE